LQCSQVLDFFKRENIFPIPAAQVESFLCVLAGLVPDEGSVDLGNCVSTWRQRRDKKEVKKRRKVIIRRKERREIMIWKSGKRTQRNGDNEVG
jgi:hypothetical protein